MILGTIVGKVSTTKFQFNVTSAKAQKFQFLQVHHPSYGFVLCQLLELIREDDKMLAKCTVIGYKDPSDNRLKGIRTPFNLRTEVLEAEDQFIKDIIKLDEDAAYMGTLEGKDLEVHVDLQKVLTRHLAVLAKSGAGKSYTVGVLLEEILERKVPLLIIDPHGEYSSLKNPSEDKEEDLLKWNIHAKGYKNQVQEFGDMDVNPNFKPLKLSERMTSYELMKLLPINLSNTQEAMLFSAIKDIPPHELNFNNIIYELQQVESSNIWPVIDTIQHLQQLNIFSPAPTPLTEIIAPGKASILNLRGVDPQIASMIVAKLLKDIFTARKKGKIPPFFCVLEEAHNFVPEKGFGNAKSSEIIRLISSEGRKFGLGLCVVSQRPALLQKTVLAQCSTQIIMKITNPNDLRVITSSAEGIGSETQEEIQNLPIGSAMICGVVDRPLVVNIRRRRSKHGGEAVNVLQTYPKENHSSNTSSQQEQTTNQNQAKLANDNGDNNSDNNHHNDSSSPTQINSKKEHDPTPNIIQEAKQFANKNLISIVPSKLSVKDIKLMSEKPISNITTYLIPAIYVQITTKEENSNNAFDFAILIDKIKGKVILDPDTDQKIEMFQIQEHKEQAAFLRKPEFKEFAYDTIIPEQLSTEYLISTLKQFCEVKDYTQTNKHRLSQSSARVTNQTQTKSLLLNTKILKVFFTVFTQSI